MQAFGYIRATAGDEEQRRQDAEKQRRIITGFCERLGVELLAFYEEHEPGLELEERPELGRMLDELGEDAADCVIVVPDDALRDPSIHPRVQVRYCAYTRCSPLGGPGECRAGYIANPERCPFS